MSLCCGLRFRRRNASFESESWAYGEKKVEKVHLDSQKTRAKSPRLFQRMLWNLHSSDWKKRITIVWHMILIWSPLRKFLIWIRFESDKERWENMYPSLGHLSHFSFHQCQAIGPFSQPSKARVHDNSLSVDFIRDMLLDSGELDVSPEVSRLLPPETWCKTHCKTLCILAFSVSVISVFDFLGKFAFSQVSRQVASATTGTGSKMATVVMLWCDLRTKIVDVSEGSALACVRHFCDGEVGHTGILGVEILGLCLSSKLCTLCFFWTWTVNILKIRKGEDFSYLFPSHMNWKWYWPEIHILFVIFPQ